MFTNKNHNPVVRWRRVAVYYGLTMLLTLLATLAWSASGGSWQGTAAAAALNACMLIPGLVALGLQRWVYREPLAVSLGLQWPKVAWLAGAWLLAPAIMLLALAAALWLIPGVHFAADLSGLEALGMSIPEIAALRERVASLPGGALPALLLQGLVLGPTLLAIGGLGEELGWRGFLQRELAPLGFGKQSVLVGLLWGGWHLPAVLQGYAYPQHPFIGCVLLLALTQLLAPLYSCLRDRSGSVLVPAVFHGTCSATSILAVAFVGGGDEVLTGFTGMAGLLATWIVGAVVVGFLRPGAAADAGTRR